MTDLTTRLREGSGPDRELDAAIWDYFNQRRPEPHRYTPHPQPALTASLDTVFALVEREGFRWSRIEGVRKDEGYLAIIETSEISQVFEIGSDRCRALLLALIAAKEPKP